MSKILHAFTFEARGVLDKIITPVRISAPTRKSDPNGPGVITVDALWDTGATGSVITPTVAANLKLTPIGKETVNGFGGSHQCNRHAVDLYMSDDLRFDAIEVSETPQDTPGFSFILGMDILSQGDFTICNNGGKSLVSFQFPSTHEFDFINEVRRSNIKVYLQILKKASPKAKVDICRHDGSDRKTVTVRQAKNLVQRDWILADV